MSFENINKLIGSLAKNIDNNEKVATPLLASKLAKYVAAYPEDQTIGTMSRVIDKMVDNNTIFIRKAELKDLYNKLYSRNTKFATLFADELGLTVSAQDDEQSYVNNHVDAELNPYESADPILANALNSVFDKHLPLKMYSQSLADKATKEVNSTLDAWNLKPTSIKVDDGNDKFLVIKADYETPKGVTSFYVPVEISNNKLAHAAVFMGNSGPQELNNTNVKDYLKKNAGSKLKINAPVILETLISAASENRQVSDAELALIRLKASRGSDTEFSQNQVIGLNIDAVAEKDVELPKYNEFESFETKFASSYGQASFQFGEDKVKLARENIARDLLGFGYKNPQITVTSSDQNTIYYAVSLDAGRVAFTVPVKLASGKLQKPSLLICNGSMSSFDKSSISKLYINNETDNKVAAVASPQFGLKPSDLIENVKSAMAEGNTAKAEDALNVLLNTGDAKAYATAFQIFMNGLGSKVATASSESSGCSLMVKSASSQHMICGHTGLPVHKVYQDQYGNCRPSYRKNMDETYEGASFMNAKIFG
jgi:hypothetical protein